VGPELINSSGITAQVVRDDGGKVTPEMIDLAKRAVACKGWRWMPGMMRLRMTQPQMRDYLRREGRVPEQFDNWAYDDWPVIPDLTDPATVGCLLALVREAWNFLVVISLGNGWWSVQTDYKDWDQDNTDSFLDALVAALTGAPL
jgi:hypothetical protein